MKLWAFGILKELPFLDDLEENIEWSLLHKVYHTMSRLVIPKGDYLFKPGQEITHLRIVQDGLLEVFSIFDEQEVILDRLMRGSILNYRTFFTSEPSQVYIRAAKNSKVMEITFEQLQRLSKESAQYERKLLGHQMKILHGNKSYPLDYIKRVFEDYMTPIEA